MTLDNPPVVSTLVLTHEQYRGREWVRPTTKIVLIGCIVWFGQDAIQEVDLANKSMREHLANRFERLGKEIPGATASPQIRNDGKYGLTTMFSADKRASISLCGSFVEIRCGDMSFPPAWKYIESLMEPILGPTYPRNSGITLEFQGVTERIDGISDPESAITDKLLRGYSRNELDGIVQGAISAASIRLYFESGDIGYTFDIGPDLCAEKSLFLRLRSKRIDCCDIGLLRAAWGKDTELWDKTAGQLLEATLRGEA